MENENKDRKAKWMHALGIAYVIAAYTFIFLALGIEGMGWSESAPVLHGTLKTILWLLPIILGIVNLIVMCSFGKKCDRDQLLNCTILVKYSLIPFYIMGGGVVALFLLSTFIPVPIMIFVGPIMAFVLCISGWLIMAGAAPFSIAYIVKAYKEGVHGKFLSIIAGISQFFFTFDVISIMILTLKEKRWKKLTLTIVTLLAALGLVCIVGIIVMIVIFFNTMSTLHK